VDLKVCPSALAGACFKEYDADAIVSKDYLDPRLNYIFIVFAFQSCVSYSSKDLPRRLLF
jgi:hypothetical protein